MRKVVWILCLFGATTIITYSSNHSSQANVIWLLYIFTSVCENIFKDVFLDCLLGINLHEYRAKRFLKRVFLPWSLLPWKRMRHNAANLGVSGSASWIFRAIIRFRGTCLLVGFRFGYRGAGFAHFRLDRILERGWFVQDLIALTSQQPDSNIRPSPAPHSNYCGSDTNKRSVKRFVLLPLAVALCSYFPVLLKVLIAVYICLPSWTTGHSGTSVVLCCTTLNPILRELPQFSSY